MNVFGGTAYLDVAELARHRRLDNARFANLLMKQKAVALPYEDPVTFAVNAAKPVVDALSPAEKDRIELLVTCTESGIDFGKSLSTYVHHHLGLNRNCRQFEIKQACYSGTAGFQMAVNFVLSKVSPGAKALIVATDISRFMVAEGGSAFLVTAAAFFFAEFGDKTQVATLMLAARYDNLIAVVCGTTLGMLCADAPAVALGTALPFALPLRAVRLAAAALFGALGAAALLGFSPF